MPWLALNYSERDKERDLSTKYHINGIPTLILIDGDSGEILCQDARNQIQNQDRSAEHFPWNSSTTNHSSSSSREKTTKCCILL